jgi:hypothetical protein
MYMTHNNHFEFGWGSDKFNFDNQTGEYWVKFGRAEYIPTSFRQECVRAATLIGQNAKRPILICLSGGMDSEVVARSFIEAGVPFEVAIMNISYRDNDNVNSHDNCYAYDYASENNIKVHIITIDLETIIREQLLSESKKYKGCYLGLIMHKNIVQNFPDYHCVLGGGDIKLSRHRNNGRPEVPGLFLEEEVISVAPLEVGYHEDRDVNNRFFMHTPELMLAWLIDHDIGHWIKHEVSLDSRYCNVNYYAAKAWCQCRHWPDIIDRPKYNGLEHVDLFDRQKNIKNDLTDIIDECKSHNQTEIIIDYNELLSMLLPRTT